MKKTDLAAGTLYTYTALVDPIPAYLVDADQMWTFHATGSRLRFTPAPGAVRSARDRGWLVLLFRVGASFEEAGAALGLTVRDLLDEQGRIRIDALPRFSRLAVVSHLWLEPTGGQ